jgi:hypothetical protein
MAHQDYSQQCPIFKEGVEKEMIAAIKTSATTSTSGPVWGIPWGREVQIVEIFAMPYCSTGGLTTSLSCSIGIYDQSLSNKIGSIAMATARGSSQTIAVVTASLTTSLNFTSTDWITFAMDVASGINPVEVGHVPVVIRYRDK